MATTIIIIKLINILPFGSFGLLDSFSTLIVYIFILPFSAVTFTLIFLSLLEMFIFPIPSTLAFSLSVSAITLKLFILSSFT